MMEAASEMNVPTCSERTTKGTIVMFHHHAFLTTLLTLATAAALFASGWVLAAPAVADPRPVATEEVVHAFYAAVNKTIQTGDTTALETALDEHVITHGPLATVAPDQTGLINYLSSLHKFDPYLKLDVTGLAITGDRAVVDVRVSGAAEGAFLGSSLHDVTLWSTIDAFRIGNRRVLEFWSGATGLVLLESQTSVPVFFGHSTEQTVTLDRLTIAPKENLLAAEQDELHWLLGETDHVTVTSIPNQTDQATPASEPISHETQLHAGDLLALPTWSSTEVRNTGLDTASLLVLTVVPTSNEHDYWGQNSQPASTTTTRWPPWRTGVSQRLGGATVTALTSDINTELPTDQAVLAVARATLAPGAVLGDLALNGPCLLVVDNGRLDLISDHLNAGTIEAATGAKLGAGSHAYLHNPGVDPTVVTLIAILPAGAMNGGSL
jgi:predicted SnoaL-like aldol condensation-catalyzing enzyme